MVITKAHACWILILSFSGLNNRLFVFVFSLSFSGYDPVQLGIDIRLMALRAMVIAFLEALLEPWIHCWWNVRTFLGCIYDCSPVLAPWLYWLLSVSELKTILLFDRRMPCLPVPGPVAGLGFAAVCANLTLVARPKLKYKS